MVSIRVQAELRHSISKHVYVETFRRVTKDNSENHVIMRMKKGPEQQDRNFWFTHDSNKFVFVFRITDMSES